MSKVFVAAGHGGADPGAVSGYGIERNIAEPVVDKAFELCASQNTNGRQLVKVPHAYGLDQAIDFINAGITNAGSDLCMEVHLNSNVGTAGTGTETYYGNVTLATEVHQEVVKVLGLRDRGIKDGNVFKFNNSTNCASCLVELGFVNNSTDVNAILDRGGLALAKGIIRACGGVYVDKPVTPPVTPPPTPNPLEAKVAELNAKIVTLNTQISNLNNTVTSNTKTINNLQADLNALQTTNNDLSSKLLACESKPVPECPECPKQPQTVGEWFNGLIKAIFKK